MTEITLNSLQQSDAPRLFSLIDTNRPWLAKFWWERKTLSVGNSEEFIHNVNVSEATNEALTRGIYLDETLIGVTALHAIDWQRRSSLLGYWLGKEHMGHGYTTWAVRQLIEIAFQEMGLAELHISTRVENSASRAVAEKLGFSLQNVREEQLWQTEESPILTATYTLHNLAGQVESTSVI